MRRFPYVITPPTATASGKRQAHFRLSAMQRGGARAANAERVIDFFDSPAVALASMVVLLFVACAVYVFEHRHALQAEQSHNQALRDAVIIADDGMCTLTFRDEVLQRWYAPGKIDSLKARLKDDAAAVAAKNALERRAVLGQLREFSVRGISDPGPLAVLPTTATADRDDAPWNSVVLPEVNQWLERMRPLFIAEKQPRVGVYKDEVFRQIRREDVRKAALHDEVMGLESNLSFAWLQVEHSSWIWEVVAWTVFGVIANTIIALIAASRDGSYKADEFILVFPKLALAPFLSIVAIALWVSGFTNAPVTFLNLPLFLVFAFSLGLVTEQLYTLMRNTANWLVTRFVTVSEDKLAEAAKNTPYKFVNPPPAAAAPQNLAQLGAGLKALANADVERGVVSQLAQIK
jgi:hypothetical protein